MAAVLIRSRRGGRRLATGSVITSHRFTDAGREYRLCVSPGGRVIMVALKCSAGGERFLAVEKPRARAIIHAAELAADAELRRKEAHAKDCTFGAAEPPRRGVPFATNGRCPRCSAWRLLGFISPAHVLGSPRRRPWTPPTVRRFSAGSAEGSLAAEWLNGDG